MKISHSIYEQKFYELSQKSMRVFFNLLEKCSNKYLKEFEDYINQYQDNPKLKWTTEIIINLSITELKSITMETRQDRALQALENMLDLILNVKVKEDITSTKRLTYSIFNQYSIDTSVDEIIIRANKNIMKYFTDLKRGYTICDPMDILKLKNQYSEKLYFLLKKWNTKHEIKLTIQEFKEYLNLPQSYVSNTSNFNRVILNTVKKELSQFFPNLEIIKIKSGTKTTHIQIKWTKLNSSEKVIKSGTLQEINNSIPVKTKGTEKAKKVISSVLEDKENSISKEELENIELTSEQISEAEYLLEQVDKVNLSFVRKFPSYKSMLKQRLQQEENQNKTKNKTN